VVDVDDHPEALMWLGHDMDALAAVLSDAPDLRWIQLPSAGIERVVEAGLLDARFTWTCAKGAFAEPVAEHALTLALAGLRLIPERVRARSWGSQGGTSLYDERVTILLSDCLPTAGDDAAAALAGIDRLHVLCPLPTPESERAAAALARAGGGISQPVRTLAEVAPALTRALSQPA